MPSLRAVLLASLAALLPAMAATAQEPLSVRPGDAVLIAVWRLDAFSGEWTVGSDGSLLHPLLTDVVVVGRSREEVRRQLRDALLRYENDPQFVIDFRYRVAVTGEVRLPGLYSLSPETTLSQAIAAGGGVAEFGRLDAVRLLRDGTETIVDLRHPTAEVAELRIRSGDQLLVVRRPSSWRDYFGLGASLVAALASIVAAGAALSR